MFLVVFTVLVWLILLFEINSFFVLIGKLPGLLLLYHVIASRGFVSNLHQHVPAIFNSE